MKKKRSSKKNSQTPTDILKKVIGNNNHVDGIDSVLRFQINSRRWNDDT